MGKTYTLWIVVLVVVVLVVVFLLTRKEAQAPSGNEPQLEVQAVTTPSGLQMLDTVVGDGAEASVGDTVTVHYTGTLDDGSKFDSSLDRGEPFSFVLGAGQVIQGWEQGFEGMKVGGKRTLIIPSELGYGDRGAGDRIPGGATLHFDVELLAVQRGQ